MAAKIRNDVPPQIGGCGIAVKADDRIAISGIPNAHFGIEHADALPAVMIGGVHISAGRHSFFAAGTRLLFYSFGIFPGWSALQRKRRHEVLNARAFVGPRWLVSVASSSRHYLWHLVICGT
jgi:hypothetical protein